MTSMDASASASCGCEWNNGVWYPCRDHARCDECGGTGSMMMQSGEVTHEMALDAGAPEMEGRPLCEIVPCLRCNGSGVIAKPNPHERLISEAAEADEVLSADEKDELERRAHFRQKGGA